MSNVNRVRQIYQVGALFVGPSPASGGHYSSGNSGVNLIKQIPRIQSVSFDTNVTRTDINQFGQLGALDRIILEPPTASLDFTYLLLDGKAESLLGFAASGESTFISGLIDKTQDEKNYFLQISKEGFDAVSSTTSGDNNVIALGNGFISNYSLSLAVGQLPQASVTVEASNAVAYTGTYGKIIPAVNPEDGQRITGYNFTLPVAEAYTGANIQSALRPGDIELSFPRTAGFGSYLSGLGSVQIQSVNIGIPLSRESINRLGSTFAFAREPQFPINSTLTVEALAADVRASSLDDILCNDTEYNLEVRLRVPNCEGTGARAVTLKFNKAKVDSTNYSMDLGGNASSSFTFSNQIAGISTDLNQGFTFSGSYS